MKTIVFMTSTRADFGKLKSLIDSVEKSVNFECHIFATGMHTLSKYGFTVDEIKKQNYTNIYIFMNQARSTDMDIILSNTILGFSNYVKEIQPDLIIVHGDRCEALAGATVGALNNILVAHIEGGELSGTIDELMRHAITKMSHIHFVANQTAQKRLIQMGEREDSIFIIGSPDIDLMISDDLPGIDEVKAYYDISFTKYSIFCYHPVTTELDSLPNEIRNTVNSVIKSDLNYVVIYPNNDTGAPIIFNELNRLENNDKFKLFPSIRFEKFLVLLKHANFVIGNSSLGIREAPFYGIPSINIGTRQKNRSSYNSIINTPADEQAILEKIEYAKNKKFQKFTEFGNGDSAKLFYHIITNGSFWETSKQKQFVDN